MWHKSHFYVVNKLEIQYKQLESENVDNFVLSALILKHNTKQDLLKAFTLITKIKYLKYHKSKQT